MTDLSAAHDFELEELDLSAATARPVDVASVAASPFQFDYSGVSSAIAQEAEAAAERIRNRHRSSIIDTGKDLLAIKDKLGHGKFGPWLEFHFSMTERTAENYISAASAFSSSPKVLDLLPITTIYKLAAKSTPDAVRQAIVGDLAGGSKMHQRDVEARIAEAKEEERRKHVEERERLAEIDAWNKHEKNMRASGKVDDEIDAERKRWDTKKARTERVKEKKAAAAKAREEQSRLEQQKLEAEREKMRQRAERVAEILRKKLGSDFDTFRALIGRFVYPEFRDAFEKL